MWRSAWRWLAVALAVACADPPATDRDDSPVDTPDIDDTVDETDASDSDTDPFETGWDDTAFGGDTGDGPSDDSGSTGPGGDSFVFSDSAECPYGEIPDCDGMCYPSYFIGDGTCDDGSAFQSNFDCVQFSFDNGDCDGDTDTMPDVDTGLDGCEWMVHLKVENWANEIGWQIKDALGHVIYDMSPGNYVTDYRDYYHTILLPDGNYTFVMIDSYGDGWHGGKYEVIDPRSGVVISTATLPNGSIGTRDFSLHCVVDTAAPPPSCGQLKLTVDTMPWAADIGWRLMDSSHVLLAEAPFGTYLPSQTYEHEAFVAEGDYIFELLDEAGDGWNGSSYRLEDTLTGRRIIGGTLISGYSLEVPFTIDCSDTDVPVLPPVSAECDPVSAVITTATKGDEVGWEVRHATTGLLAGASPPGSYQSSRVYTVPLPLMRTGAWTVRLVDSAGDGWGATTFQLVDSSGGVVAEAGPGFTMGFEEFFDVALECPEIEEPIDTAVCAPDTIVDCDGVCWPISYVGDGFCDDGSTYAADFFCAGLMWDMGDCGAPP